MLKKVKIKEHLNFSYSQTAIKVLHNLQINFKLQCDRFQSFVMLAEHNRVQMMWMSGHVAIEVNETTDQEAKDDSSYSFIGHQPQLGITAKVAKGLSRSRLAENMMNVGISYKGKDRIKDFLKNSLLKKPGELHSLSRNQLRMMTGFLIGHSHK